MATNSAARRRVIGGHGLDTYGARRDFAVTAEPAPGPPAPHSGASIFVVQKHAARRLHWDFRLEHGGVLWSWAVPKGPSRDPGDKRLAVHVEDHPLDYADFQGRIPDGEYGAGTVETWDRGTWQPVGDAEEGLRRGELKFTLAGQRLRGGFVLVRLKPRPKQRGENWLLIKEHDAAEQAGADAAALEASPPAADGPPVPGAVRGGLPTDPAPQLAALAGEPPDGPEWISEVKFDGYRLLVRIEGGAVRLITRSGQDWTARLPGIASLFAGSGLRDALLDGELVALRPDGVSSFPDLQDALSRGRDGGLYLYLFDLLHLDGWDLRPCRLADRKAALRGLLPWSERLRFSDHIAGKADAMRRRACALGLEGIVCKRADAPYRAGRGHGWVKVKCQEREEFVVLGWTPPAGHRTGLGALQLGFYAPDGTLHYIGGVGTGFTDRELGALRKRLDALRADPPEGLRYGAERPDRRITWVRPELVAEVQYLGMSGGGRLRQAVFLGVREDKAAREVVREVPNPELTRQVFRSAARTRIVGPRKAGEGGTLTNADKELWPGITKADLAAYWRAVAPYALPEIAGRPLAFVRCPDGIAGPHFFQKHRSAGFPPQIRTGESDGAPWLAIDDLEGLLAAVQMAAIELHAWGASGADPLHPDRLVFDLDPGEGVAFSDVVAAAKEVRARLAALGLAAFCRTTGGKGLHVVVPLVAHADWEAARIWCRRFAERMAQDQPDRYVASVPKARRRGHILVDWLRNSLGAIAIASFSPRARPGAGVATPLAWREVTASLDPVRFTLRTVPDRLARQRRDPWEGFAAAAKPLPEATP